MPVGEGGEGNYACCAGAPVILCVSVSNEQWGRNVYISLRTICRFVMLVSFCNVIMVSLYVHA